MSSCLEAKFTPAFSKDLKKKASKRNWNLSDLESVIDLILDNSAKSIETLKRRRNMHRLSGKWEGSSECHVANAGDWLLVWCVGSGIAYFQRTGSHEELFR
ncbi:type II toxin-antitoxin system RelE/ParE family toxin [Adlercreutzia mucosicola]|uniref:type II toxin-antitoxin system RelE/ParE family toxin n=1 Tax=Adlercreutzia mucosicola TaxID=580026 RepID=UPI000A03F4DD|nr:type II toxin-antitoxin system YafQ family toxin [Adlercreutzia mucosicola]MCR2034300.1 type II toxin-antitoxin system YafQ family toxin [Adlercreutzia mucosicola]